MGAILGRLAAVLSGSLVTLFGTWKTFFVGLFLAAAGVVFYNVVVSLISELLNYALSEINSANPSGGSLLLSLSGLSAWFATKLRLTECLTWVMTCVGVRVTLKAIPFIRVN